MHYDSPSYSLTYGGHTSGAANRKLGFEAQRGATFTGSNDVTTTEFEHAVLVVRCSRDVRRSDVVIPLAHSVRHWFRTHGLRQETGTLAAQRRWTVVHGLSVLCK